MVSSFNRQGALLRSLSRLRRISKWRLASGAASLLLVGGSVAAGGVGVEPQPQPATQFLLAEELPDSTWGMTLPTSWLATPLEGVAAGDRLDLLALTLGQRTTATAIAFDLLVIRVDRQVLVVAVTAPDATSISIARASGQLIVPLLRSPE